LAYVEWFTPFANGSEPNHGLYKVSQAFWEDDKQASIVPMHNIQCSIHLMPQFGAVAPWEWTISNV
ncbi:hypothetical protein BDR06DRAFT_833686, partial [Suillus hirtellus]